MNDVIRHAMVKAAELPNVDVPDRVVTQALVARRFKIPEAQRKTLEHFVWNRGWHWFAPELDETLAKMRDAGYLVGRWSTSKDAGWLDTGRRRDGSRVIEWRLRGRNMSFMLTPQQVVSGSKTVTRRLGWPKLRAGELLYACKKCQGRKPGEPLVGLAILGVVDVRRERLDAIDEVDVVREGFPEMTPAEFIEMFCKEMKKCTPDTVVTRIEFERLA